MKVPDGGLAGEDPLAQCGRRGGLPRLGVRRPAGDAFASMSATGR